eukprot:SAG31_NODE_5406_length_2555_cov_1.521580_3_plen_59_part_00
MLANAGATVRAGAHGSTGVMAMADPVSGLAMCCLTPSPDLCYSAEFNQLCDLFNAACV